MKTPEVLLAGEEHHQHSYIMAEIALIKRLVAEGAISALSLELEYYKYGEVEADINSVGRIAPIVSLARRNHLDILPSDYRDTFIGHVIKELRKRDDRSNAPDSEKEVSFLSDLKPLVFEGPEPLKSEDSLYTGFCPRFALAEDFFDFLNYAYYEERERFTANRLISYLKRKPGSRILHICGLLHVERLKELIEKAGYAVEMVDLLGAEEK